ncbi:MAG: hypothetical protein FJ135_15810 [Deltaproteobacteria bacterium]|nr:hypothetical protein [Deltaproteobacteria bacterium]
MVIQFDPQRKRQRQEVQPGTGPGKVLRLDQLSNKVLLQVTQRQAAREIEQLHYLLKITGGDPTIVPTLQQMEGIIDGTIEY